jgi:ATP-binding protein involved in chromosome partitioning
MVVTIDHVKAVLAHIVDPGRGEDIVTAGLVSDIAIDGDHVRVVMEVPAERGAALTPIAKAAEAALSAVDKVGSAHVILTAEVKPGAPTPPTPDLRDPAGGSAHISAQKPLRRAPQKAGPIDGIDRIIAIGSGKGGVGKSTVSANLAVSLAQAGRRVGLLDADVYGPSQPWMLGLSEKPRSPDGKTILPSGNHGVTVMSIGLLIPDDKAVIWRGPILIRALQQMLRQVAWGRLDVLLVDLPPGTGDVQLTLSQKAEVTGAIVVSTPQDLALLDARKAVDMFVKTQTPIIGFIENMATFHCPNCGHETPLFGHGGARAEAEKIGAPFLGEIPLDIDVRLAGDSGAPIVSTKPDSPPAQRFHAIAQQLIDQGHT